MSAVKITIAINGVVVPVTLDDVAVATIAEAVATSASQSAEPWPEWMEIRTAARYLDVSIGRIRSLIKAHAIPLHQEARCCRIFFHRSELDSWMRGFQQTKGGDA